MAILNSGDFRTPVQFLENTPNDGFEPGENPTKVVFTAWAHVYGASSKDNGILGSNGYASGLTIKIRDTRGEFVPNPRTQSVFVDDYRYNNVGSWDLVDVRPDFENDAAVVCVLGNPQMKSGDDLAS